MFMVDSLWGHFTIATAICIPMMVFFSLSSPLSPGAPQDLEDHYILESLLHLVLDDLCTEVVTWAPGPGGLCLHIRYLLLCNNFITNVAA